jgi:DNA-binding PadR family transcriptional regulator
MRCPTCGQPPSRPTGVSINDGETQRTERVYRITEDGRPRLLHLWIGRGHITDLPLPESEG